MNIKQALFEQAFFVAKQGRIFFVARESQVVMSLFTEFIRVAE
jgi:hypothetical protein